jgi:hypothetical protein
LIHAAQPKAGESLKMFRSIVVVVGLPIALGLLSFSHTASAASIPIYGGPTYTTSGGGYRFAQARGAADGAGVGFAEKSSVGGAGLGGVAVRWGPFGYTELAPLGVSTQGTPYSEPRGINNAGFSTGFSYKSTPGGGDLGRRAVRWDATGAATELDTLGTQSNGVAQSEANAINGAGTVVGWANIYTAAGLPNGVRAVRWNAGGAAATELGVLPHGSNSTDARAYAVNDSGAAVGYAYHHDAAGVVKGQRAVRWEANSTAATELGYLGADTDGTTDSIALAINAAGTAVGWADKYNGGGVGMRPVRWDAGSTAATELGLLGVPAGGLGQGQARDVNSAGTTVGYAGKYDAAGNSKGSRAVRWDAGSSVAIELALLGTSSTGMGQSDAFDINDDGFSVGYSFKYTAGGSPVGNRAVYWAPDGSVVDLNTLIDPTAAAGWTLTAARGISDAGWISGIGSFDPDGGGSQAPYDRLFLLQIPEPGSLTLAGTVATAMLLRRRRRRKGNMTQCASCAAWRNSLPRSR